MNEEDVHRAVGSNVFVNVYDAVSLLPWLLPTFVNSLYFKKEYINTAIDVYTAYLNLSSHMMKLLITGIHLFMITNLHQML